MGWVVAGLDRTEICYDKSDSLHQNVRHALGLLCNLL